VEDDELTRARRALRGVDPEIDLRRTYAESWARAHDAEAPQDWATDERVEIVLHGTGPDGLPTRRNRRVPRRGPVLAWGAAAAAAAAVVAVVMNVAGPPPQGTAPGGAPPTSSVSAPSGSATTDPGATPSALPSSGLTSAAVVDRAAHAVATASCGLETRSTLGDDSKIRVDEPGATDDKTPTAAPLDQQPLPVLQTVATDVVLQLVDLEGADYRLHDNVTLEEDAGETLVQIRFTPPAGLVPGGEVTRIELLIDLTTWLPHSEQTWAVSDGGTEHLLLSEFNWTTCGGASPSTTDAPP
jgi:hypothetical protein